MTFDQVIKELREEQATPGRLADIRLFLSAEYGFVAGQLEAILRAKPAVWMRLREAVESDKQADRRWDASPDGQLEMSYRFKLKSIEKLISACRTRIEVAMVEARHVV